MKPRIYKRCGTWYLQYNCEAGRRFVKSKDLIPLVDRIHELYREGHVTVEQ